MLSLKWFSESQKFINAGNDKNGTPYGAGRFPYMQYGYKKNRNRLIYCLLRLWCPEQDSNLHVLANASP